MSVMKWKEMSYNRIESDIKNRNNIYEPDVFDKKYKDDHINEFNQTMSCIFYWDRSFL